MVSGKRARATVLDRVRASLEALARESAPGSVHFFRTSCRRLQAYAELLGGEAGRSLRKLNKRLQKARRLAGSVRDFDVQLALLREVEIEREDRRRLLAAMEESRARAARKLARHLDQERVAELRARIAKARRRTKAQAETPAVFRELAWQQAVEALSGLAQQFPAVETGNLHEVRLACKGIRYTAEQALPQAGAAALVEQMKQVQDAIGVWHDWVVLRERGRELLPAQSPLLHALRNHERTSRATALRQARAVTRPHIRVEPPPALPAPAKRPEAAERKPRIASAS